MGPPFPSQEPSFAERADPQQMDYLYSSDDVGDSYKTSFWCRVVEEHMLAHGRLSYSQAELTRSFTLDGYLPDALGPALLLCRG